MVFTGTYPHTIDAKQRLAIPAELRATLRERCQVRDDEPLYVYATPAEGRCLALYAVPDFEEQARTLRDSEADFDSPELFEFALRMFANSRRLELDRQGRVRLPDQLLKLRQIGGEVVVVGNNDRIEVHNREDWDRFMARSLEDDGDMMLKFRRAMRKRRD